MDNSILIDVLSLEERAEDLLQASGISTIAQLLKYDRAQLIALDGIGEVTADKILGALAAWKQEQADAALEDVSLSEAETAKRLAVSGMSSLTDKDRQIQQLISTARWAMEVFRRQHRGGQGQHLAGQLAKSVTIITGLSFEQLADVPPELSTGA